MSNHYGWRVNNKFDLLLDAKINQLLQEVLTQVAGSKFPIQTMSGPSTEDYQLLKETVTNKVWQLIECGLAQQSLVYRDDLKFELVNYELVYKAVIICWIECTIETEIGQRGRNKLKNTGFKIDTITLS